MGSEDGEWCPPLIGRERKEDVLPCFLPALKISGKPRDREQRGSGRQGVKKSRKGGCWLTPRAAHPGRALFPRLAGVLRPALQREGVRWAAGREHRGYKAAGGLTPPAPVPAPSPATEPRTAWRGWAQERWETQCPHTALSPGCEQRVRQSLTTLGRVPAALQEIPTVSPTQPHKHVDPAGGPALPPTWAWPCPGPTGGASHPVRLCATPGGPGRSALAPASTGRSPSPPPGAPPLAGGELGQGPGLDSGAPGHPAGRRHKAPWGRNRKSPELGKGIQNLLTPSCLKALRSPHQKN